MNLYQTIAEQLRQQIDNGCFPDGQRLPSLRSLASQLGVSISTVLQAYALLETEGRITPRPQSGYFVCKKQSLATAPASVSQLRPSRLDMSDAITSVLANTSRDDLCQLGAAVPATAFQPSTAFNRAWKKASKLEGEAFLKEIFTPGDLGLRRQIAQRMVNTGCLIDPENITITHGCQDALLLTLKAITRPGDIVAIESPCYYGMLLSIESLGLKTISIATDPANGLDLGALSKAAAKHPIKALFCSPCFSNPSGGSMTDQNKRQLLEIAKQYRFTIIEDDIYGELSHSKQRPIALKAFDQDDRVIYCSSFSKSIAPGLRIGWLVAGKHQQKIQEYQLASTMAVSTPTQFALGEFIASGDFDRHLRRIRPLYHDNINRARRVIAESFPKGTSASDPNGGYLLWLALPKRIDSYHLYEAALTEKISIVPGRLFGRRGFDHYLRINCALPWSAAVESHLRTIGQLAKSLQTEK